MSGTSTLLILCGKRSLDSFVDELDDWKEEGATTLLHGITGKTGDGFLIVQWDKPVPSRFRQKLREDEEVNDFFAVVDSTMTITPPIIPPQL
jgi:hypothetical protein